MIYFHNNNGDDICFKITTKCVHRTKRRSWKIFYYHYNIKLPKTFMTYRSSHQRCSVKKVFLEISQNSQENTCARVSFLIKLQDWSARLLKKRLWQRCFPVNFAKFLRKPCLQNTSGRMLLNTAIIVINSKTSISHNFS